MAKRARVILRYEDGRPAAPETVAMHAWDKLRDAANRASGLYLTAEDCRALYLCVTNMSGPNFEYEPARWREAGYWPEETTEGRDNG